MTHRDVVHYIGIGFLAATLELCVSPAMAQSLPRPPLTYNAISDRLPRPEAAVPPALGPAGSTFIDPDFGTRILRVSDPYLIPGFANGSYTTMASGENVEWNADSTKFLLGVPQGYNALVTFDAAAFTTTLAKDPTNPSAPFYYLRNFTQWSFTDPNIYYGACDTGHMVCAYDITTGHNSMIVDWDTIIPTAGLPPVYYGGGASVSKDNNIFLTAIGGHQQSHPYIAVYNATTKQSAVLDMANSQIRAYGTATFAPTAFQLGFGIHSAFIDHSGRYATFVGGDVLNPSNNNPNKYDTFVWDLQTNTFQDINKYCGHAAFGYGQIVAMSATLDQHDSYAWFFRPLNDVNNLTELALPEVPEPHRFEVDGHPSWNNSVPGVNVPFVQEVFVTNLNHNWYPLRAWDNEVIAVATDGSNKVWRFAHTYSGIYNSFYDQPRLNVSQNGRYAVITTNWKKTLGYDNDGNYRYDVMLVDLDQKYPAKPISDQTPPSKPYFLYLQNGQNVSGTFDFSVSASDNVGVTTMLYRTGSYLTIPPLTHSPFTFKLDTRTLPDAQYTWAVVAYDSQGNSSQSDYVTFTVDNAHPPPNPPAAPVVMLSPTAVTLFPNGQQAFSAAVKGGSETAVKWSISPPIGRLENGVFTAPAAVSSEQRITVTATSVVNPYPSASALITVVPNVFVSVTPAQAHLFSNQGLRLSAAVVGTLDSRVTWSLSPELGTLLPDGSYRAPSDVSLSQKVTLTAASVADSRKSASAEITIDPAPSIRITPVAMSMLPGSVQQFIADVSGVVPNTVQWTISPARGTITAAGVYTSPTDVAANEVVTIRAISVAYPAVSSATYVSLVASPLGLGPPGSSH